MPRLQRRLSSCLYFLFLWLILSSSASAGDGPPRITASLDKEQAVIAEPVTYSLIITTGDETLVKLPDAAELGNFTVSDFRISEEAGPRGEKKIRAQYILKSFEAGTQVIPALAVYYRPVSSQSWEESAVGERSVTITSALEPDEKERRLRDIKGPVDLRVFPWWPVALLLLAAGGFLTAWWLRRTKSRMHRPVEPEQIIPAHLIALGELDELKKKDYVGRGLIKEYFIEVSGIVRRYLERRFNLHAPEMTTEEFLLHVKEGSALIGEHKQLLKEFLECCDLVKFAKYAPTAQEIESAYEAAVRFVEQTQ